MNDSINNNLDVNKKSISFIILILILILTIAGFTYALSNLFTVNNGSYISLTTCFDIDYDVTNDDGTMPITGNMLPSSGPIGGLSGKVSMKINASCVDVEKGKGTLFLNVVNTSDVMIQTVGGHCEDSQTLRTMTSYTTSSSCTANTNRKWVTDGSALKYAIYDSADVTKDTIPLSVGYVNKTGSIQIYDNIPISHTSVTYYVYIWLDGNLSDNTYAGLQFNGNISSSVEQLGEEETSGYKEKLLNGADPVLDDGMVPIVLSDTGVATVANLNEEWYNYENKEWANVVLVKESGIKTREYYLSNPGTEVSESDILAYYVWVPRYKYKIWTTDATTFTNPQTINIVFEGKNVAKSNGNTVGDYLTHPAFTFGNEELNGIWVGKFETSHSTLSSSTSNNLGCTNENCVNADGLIIKPNVSSLRYDNVSNQFYASRSMERSGNPFGLNSSNVDSHMMKNSEWGAVAYLSHSTYGINEEIYINNSSSYYTGRSAGEVGNENNETASYGTYSWTGQTMNSDGSYGAISDSTLGTKASTTGNVTGVYDMSGGAWEYVMGVLSDSNGNPRSGYSTDLNSGFNGIAYDGGTYTSGISFPNSKYYDLYLESQFNGDDGTNITLCTLETCGGHALNETAGWYSDYAGFVGLEYPWFLRGGGWVSDVNAGAFFSGSNNGNGNFSNSWRSVLTSDSSTGSGGGGSTPEVSEYTITYSLNGGIGEISSGTKTHDVSLTLSSVVPTRDGYNFLGWSTSSTATSAEYLSGGSYTANESVTLYAVWQRKTYTITYNANGGSRAPVSETKFHDATLILSSEVPTRTGYNFLGWSEDSSATSATYQSGGEYIDNKSTTLYAVWKIKTYQISYNACSGTGVPGAQIKTYGEELVLNSQIPIRNGYTFIGWATSTAGGCSATSASYQPGSIFEVNAETTLYAVWLNAKYTDSILNGADPVFDSGMVPIILSSTGVATVADISSEWYNYGDKEWANVVLVKRSGSKTREYYLSNPGTTVSESDILAYYVWVPRYRYQIWSVNGSSTSDSRSIIIEFEKNNVNKSSGTSVNQWLTHPAFTFGDKELNGIWVGKFETTGNTTTPTIKPNQQSLRYQKVSEQFITSLKFAGGTMNTSTGVVTFTGSNTYGLTSTVDSHMMKNSEWGVVAYLSHSEYGINQEIYINNSEEYYTGRSGGNVGGSHNTVFAQFGSGSTSIRYNTYGYYTWTGQAIDKSGNSGLIGDATLGTKASTTGNVTGVYDMSGGADEYVMGNYNNTLGSSGFTIFPQSKYYDLYTITSNSSCTLATCGGHALYETAYWYDDTDIFVSLDRTWFMRGLNGINDDLVGVFSSRGGNGSFSDYISWRSVLVV